MRILSFLELLLAGIAWTFPGLGRVKEDVVIDGLNVGGATYEEAVRALRELPRDDALVVHTPKGDVVVPAEEFTLSDDAETLVRSARKGDRLSLARTRAWANEESALLEICARCSEEAESARLSFSAEGFEYVPEKPGLGCDYFALLRDADEALRRGLGEVTLRTHPFSPAVTLEDLKARTRLLSRRSTRFDPSNLPRVHNVALAASRIAGTTIGPGEEFSFNRAVGPRTEENGFRVAAVIQSGEFVPGVGGGVCQVSTTLYLAALEAGMTVTEARAHSLSVGYAPPSLDAMVSGASDLKFVNPYPEPVYLLAETGENGVEFSFYGRPDGKRRTLESVTLAHIPPDPPEEAEGESGVLRAAKDGIVSESYLVVTAEDGQTTRTRLRLDKYAPVRGKVGKAPPPEEGASPEEGEERAREDGASQTEEENSNNLQKGEKSA